MTDSNFDFADQPRRGLASQIVTTVFVGIPMTLALVVALGFYCTFEFARYALSPKREVLESKTEPLPVTGSEEVFTASLASFAQIHGATPKIESTPAVAPELEKTPSVESVT